MGCLGPKGQKGAGLREKGLWKSFIPLSPTGLENLMKTILTPIVWVVSYIIGILAGIRVKVQMNRCLVDDEVEFRRRAHRECGMDMARLAADLQNRRRLAILPESIAIALAMEFYLGGFEMLRLAGVSQERIEELGAKGDRGEPL
jgi:hypothetical protein